MISFFDRFRNPEPPDQTDPDVIVDFIFDRGSFFISIKNIGFAPAYHVAVNFNKKITGVEGTKKITELPLFKDLLFLPADKEINTFLDTSASYFKREEPTSVTTRIAFKNRDGKRFKNTISHDLNIYKEIGYLSSST